MGAEINMINTENWGEFYLKDIFPKIERGTRLTQYDREPGNIPLATAGYQNEGIADFISNTEQKRYKNKITIDMFCNVFYRNYTFCCDDNIIVLINDDLNENICLFLTSIISKDKFRFAYGRQYRKKDYLKHMIKLPITLDGKPNWKFMNDYIEELQSRERESSGSIKDALNTKINNRVKINLTKKFKEFQICDLFNVTLSKGDIKEDDCNFGPIPLVSSGSTNNGIVKFIDEKGDGKAEIFSGNCLTIDMFCNCFYQPKGFYAVSHGRVNILIPKFNMNKETGLFIASIIKREQYRFSYGRAVYSSVAEKINIELPVDENGNLDINFITDFINLFPYSDRI